MGLLIAEGRIDVAQFWPDGESDADTTKVEITRFLYDEGDGSNARETTVFRGAKTRGKTSKPVLDKQDRITVRYQGIDAPELHYQAQAEIRRDDPDAEKKKEAFHEVNKRYRQHFGKMASVRLAEHVKELAGSADTIDCRVVTRVDFPNEVFDTYGRFIGNIVVAGNHDLNVWLVENGWAFPTFYASMRPDEIQTFLDATEKAKARGIWKRYTGDLNEFEWKLLYDKRWPDSDAGPVVLPKMFRRLVAYHTNKKAKIVSGSFSSYLQRRHPPEACFETADLLEHGLPAATPRFIHEFVEGATFTARPEGLVFQEAPSTLYDASGTKITSWRSGKTAGASAAMRA